VSKLSNLASTLRYAVAARGSQNFLGSSWVRGALGSAKDKRKRALRLLFFSPHYFCLDRASVWPSHKVLEQEAERNRSSRQLLAEKIVSRFCKSGDVVLDFGCGPGFLAAAVAPLAGKIYACDISDGVLACARVINPAANVEYMNVADLPGDLLGRADLVYSFAVAQHLSDSILAGALAAMSAVLRTNGTLLLHVVIDSPGWNTEAEWLKDDSLNGRLKMRFGLHCFSRSRQQATGLVAAAGLAVESIQPMCDYLSVDDDLATQHLLIARKR
jgi:SAM-dependent methyltransferase